MQLICPHFLDQQMIPKKYTCKGNNISPPLQIKDIPAGTASLALIVHDPDAPGGDYTHWLMWNIPPNATEATEGSMPTGATEGTNDFGKQGYGGPCPPSGTHRYVFDLYALDTTLSLPTSIKRRQLVSKLNGHILTQTTLTGLFSANNH